jgi:flagellar basal-body rod protein FlgB
VALFDLTQTAIERALAGSAVRQGLIADNIANASTPGYKRTDVDFQSVLAGALSSGDETNVKDVQFSPQVDSSVGSTDGNNVDIETEMADMSENAATYQALLAVAKARNMMIQTALGR